MRLTVLGCYGPYPAPGAACSGYLVEEGDTKLVCDLGSGTLSRLLTKVSVSEITAVVLSHLHFDHCSDVLVLQYALELLAKQGELPRPLPLYAPATPAAHLALLKPAYFDVIPVSDGMEAAIGSLRARFFAVRHPVEAYAVELAQPDGKRLFYTGDTGYFDELAVFARGADALLADAAFPASRAAGALLPHMTTKEAAQLSENARVKRLFATHLSPGGASREQMEKEIDFTPKTVVQELGQYEI